MRLDMPVIETERLLLRPIEEEDVSDIFEYYHDTAVMKYLTFLPHASIDDTLRVVRYYLSYERQGVPQTWAMVHKDHDKVIGHLNFHTIEEDIGEIGYVLHPSYWNQGLMKEALQELVYVGFWHIGLRRIEAKAAVEHGRSAALLEKCHFKKEGVLRKYTTLSDGVYHDMILFSLLKEDIKECKNEKNIRC